MTRVLVTGGSGQLGRCIADLRADRRFDALDLIVAPRNECDIANPASVNAAVERIDPDVIVNAAGFTAVDAAEGNLDQAMRANHDGVANLAAVGVRLIHISTDYVFDGSSTTPYTEADPVAPLGVYGRSKALGEEAASEARSHLILRTGWVYSAYGTNFVKTMLGLGSTHDHLCVVADQVGNPTSAHDLAIAVLRLAATETLGMFHLAGTDTATWHEFAVEIFELAGLTVEVEAVTTADYPTPAARPANSRLDSAALAKATGVALPGWRQSLPGVIKQIQATTD